MTPEKKQTIAALAAAEVAIDAARNALFELPADTVPSCCDSELRDIRHALFQLSERICTLRAVVRS
jgi:hypothetical protein